MSGCSRAAHGSAGVLLLRRAMGAESAEHARWSRRRLYGHADQGKHDDGRRPRPDRDRLVLHASAARYRRRRRNRWASGVVRDQHRHQRGIHLHVPHQLRMGAGPHLPLPLRAHRRQSMECDHHRPRRGRSARDHHRLVHHARRLAGPLPRRRRFPRAVPIAARDNDHNRSRVSLAAATPHDRAVSQRESERDDLAVARASGSACGERHRHEAGLPEHDGNEPSRRCPTRHGPPHAGTAGLAPGRACRFAP